MKKPRLEFFETRFSRPKLKNFSYPGECTIFAEIQCAVTFEHRPWCQNVFENHHFRYARGTSVLPMISILKTVPQGCIWVPFVHTKIRNSSFLPFPIDSAQTAIQTHVSGLISAGICLLLLDPADFTPSIAIGFAISEDSGKQQIPWDVVHTLFQYNSHGLLRFPSSRPHISSIVMR